MEAGTLGISTSALILGGAVAAVTGVLAIKTFVILLERKAFHAFGAYCALAGAAFLAFLSRLEYGSRGMARPSGRQFVR